MTTDEPSPRTNSESAASTTADFFRTSLPLLTVDRTTLFAALAAAVALTVSRYHVNVAEYRRLFATDAAAALPGWLTPVAEYLYWFTGSAVLFHGLPRVVGRLLGIRGESLGAGSGDVRFGLKAAALLYLGMLPLVFVVSRTDAFGQHYPMSPGALTSVRALLAYETGYAAYFVAWEFVFRGLLCVALFPRLGAATLYLHAIPFAVLHAGKPELEAYGSIPAALALGVLAVRTGSFWYGAILHVAVAWTMDVLAMASTHRFPKAW